MAVLVCSVVMMIGVASRLCNCLSVVRLVLSEVNLVGLVKCLLKELAMCLFVVWSVS